ncbi:serine hydrolase domain-containing protein [Rhodococcoides fascians]|uniref:serine hydrolase domain-containing protein n=2 Tax=Rhodococcoides fascians TaxID=1828 RepID=UPI0009D6A5F4|nr:serine hydrolase domain-containing protein [Rhodococcus fascians]
MSGAQYSAPLENLVAPGFEVVSQAFERMQADDPTYAAQFSAYVDGVPVIDIWGGPEIATDSLLGVFSATKGVSAICIALLVERGQLDLDERVTAYWPEFGAGGKQSITVRTVLSHQAGLSGVEPQVSLKQVIDHPYMADRLARQAPHWRPGSAHGYHALTIGTVMEELARRIDGRSLAVFFLDDIAGPRDVDVHVAASAIDEQRVLDVYPPRPPADVASDEAPAADGLSGMAFNAAVEDIFDPPLVNLRAVRASGQAASAGVASARGLARLYAGSIGEVDGTPRLLSPETVAAVSQLQVAGDDLVLGQHSRFAIGFQKPDDRLRFGSHRAFGHDGAGGAMGVADPWHNLAYGYIPRRMVTPSGADPRGLELARLVRRCLGSRRS